MTHDELLAKIKREEDFLKTQCFDGNLIGTFTVTETLRAVVELHKPCEPVSDDRFVTCETCNYEYNRGYPWPCETIQAIEKELG